MAYTGFTSINMGLFQPGHWFIITTNEDGNMPRNLQLNPNTSCLSAQC